LTHFRVIQQFNLSTIHQYTLLVYRYVKMFSFLRPFSIVAQ